MPLNCQQMIEASERGSCLFREHIQLFDAFSLEDINSVSERFLDFVPIRIVSIIEVCTRLVVCEAVNHGDPYTQRGIDIISKWSGRNLASALHAVHQKRLTVGVLVGHGFSIGRMSEIISTLKALFGEDLKKELAESRERWVEDEKEGVKSPLLMPDMDSTFSYLDRLLQVRHIIVHECPRDPPYLKEELPTFLEHARAFVSALDWLLVARLYGPVPRTQREMNTMAGTRAEKAQEELNALRGGNSNHFQSPKTPEDEIEYHWDRFCDLSAQLRAGYLSEESPGTIAPMVYASEHEYLNQWRIEHIRRHRGREEGEF